MQRRRRQSWSDLLLVWGFVASFLGLFGLACFEAAKIFAAVPAAFNSSPIGLRNPMEVSDGDYQPSGAMGSRQRMTPKERALQGGRGAQP
jgi:hypothetical protein